MDGHQKILEVGADVIADELERLQADKNQGRGVSCVRTIIMYLRRGGIESAISIRRTEGDKTRSYKDIERYLSETF